MNIVKIAFLCVLFLGLLSFGAGAKSQVSALFEKGQEHIQSGKYREAVEAFSEALEFLEPDEKNAHVVMLSRARAYYHLGQFDNARRDVDRVVESGATDGENQAQGYLLKGMIARREGNDTRALSNFTAAIKTRHENTSLRSSSFTNRGIVHLDMGDTDKALSDLNKAIELDSTYAAAYAARGLTYLRQDRIEAARKDGERTMLLNPDKNAEKMARTILDELSIAATGPQSVSVPMNDQGHIFVQVRFSKTGKPRRFLLDTGATYSLIDSTLLGEIQKETDVKTVGKSKVKTADGRIHTVTRYKVGTAFLFNMPLGEMEVHVLDGQGQKITNLLGVKSLQGIAVSLDNSEKKAELRRRTPGDGSHH
ncbi:MAG TPA: tetratricopeptide repeat protein [Desulfomonilaceae bacterium]|nr:tetratricopeptide repeat protein [Desulfomonilaceae bacterium]